MKPKDKAHQIIKAVFDLQHTDDRAKMICLSTPLIAIMICEEAKLAAATALTIVDRRKENQGIDDIIDTDDILNDSCVPYWDEVIKEIKINFC